MSTAELGERAGTVGLWHATGPTAVPTAALTAGVRGA